MSAVLRMVWVLLLVAVAAGLAVAGRGYAVAKGRASLALQRHGMVIRQVRELERARPIADEWRDRKRPASGLATNLGQTLAACGIPPQALVNVAPQPETPLHGETGGADLRRQRATFMLTPVTLPQLGAFLELWRTREPYWTVASIDVSPETTHGRPPTGGDLPLRAAITVDAVYLADPKEERK